MKKKREKENNQVINIDVKSMPLYLVMKPKMIIIVANFPHPFYISLAFYQPLS